MKRLNSQLIRYRNQMLIFVGLVLSILISLFVYNQNNKIQQNETQNAFNRLLTIEKNSKNIVAISEVDSDSLNLQNITEVNLSAIDIAKEIKAFNQLSPTNQNKALKIYQDYIETLNQLKTIASDQAVIHQKLNHWIDQSPSNAQSEEALETLKNLVFQRDALIESKKQYLKALKDSSHKGVFEKIIKSSKVQLSTQLSLQKLRYRQSQFLAMLALIFITLFFYYQSQKPLKAIRSDQKLFSKKKQKLYQLVSDTQDQSTSKTNFLAVLSYEVRTSLDAMLGLTRMVKKTSENHQQINKLQQVLRSGNELHNLLNDVILFVDLETHSIQIDKQVVSIEKLLHRLKERYVSLAQEKNILFDVDISSELSKYYLSDKAYVYKVIDYLLSNAFEHTEKGHIGLKVSLDQLNQYSEDAHRINFEIIDTGSASIGNDEQQFFNPFKQSLTLNSRNSGAKGLKISIVQQLIHCLDGQIDIETCNSKGLKFRFYIQLPVADQADIQKEIQRQKRLKKQQSHANNIDSMNILVAEDNCFNASLMTWILEDSGHQVDVAENGVECLHLLDRNQYDLIFMDQHMPVMNGTEATIKIRGRQDSKAKIPIIGCTADALKEVTEQLMNIGQNDVLNKPISDNELHKVIVKYSNGDYFSDGFNDIDFNQDLPHTFIQNDADKTKSPQQPFKH